MTYWTNKQVIVTGGAGFLGSFVVEKLKERGAREIVVPLIEDYDLTQITDIRRLLDLESRISNVESASISNLESRIAFSISNLESSSISNLESFKMKRKAAKPQGRKTIKNCALAPLRPCALALGFSFRDYFE